MTDVKIKCDSCKFVDGCVDYGWSECRKFTLKPSEPMTNEEWFCGLSTEEKAERIISLCVTYFDRTDLSIVGAVKESIKINDHYDGHVQKDLLVEWLKQPHTFK